MGKNHTWTNTWASTAGASKSKGFQNEVKTNFGMMQEQMIALQRHIQSLEEQLLRKDTGTALEVVVMDVLPTLGVELRSM